MEGNFKTNVFDNVEPHPRQNNLVENIVTNVFSSNVAISDFQFWFGRSCLEVHFNIVDKIFCVSVRMCDLERTFITELTRTGLNS